jgi:hypothetical protein
MVGFDHFIGVFNYGAMSPEIAEKSLRLFAGEVAPHLQALPALEGADADLAVAAG